MYLLWFLLLPGVWASTTILYRSAQTFTGAIGTYATALANCQNDGQVFQNCSTIFPYLQYPDNTLFLPGTVYDAYGSLLATNDSDFQTRTDLSLPQVWLGYRYTQNCPLKDGTPWGNAICGNGVFGFHSFPAGNWSCYHRLPILCACINGTFLQSLSPTMRPGTPLPTTLPTVHPTHFPTLYPTTLQPSLFPTSVPTSQPTALVNAILTTFYVNPSQLIPTTPTQVLFSPGTQYGLPAITVAPSGEITLPLDGNYMLYCHLHVYLNVSVIDSKHYGSVNVTFMSTRGVECTAITAYSDYLVSSDVYLSCVRLNSVAGDVVTLVLVADNALNVLDPSTPELGNCFVQRVPDPAVTKFTFLPETPNIQDHLNMSVAETYGANAPYLSSPSRMVFPVNGLYEFSMAVNCLNRSQYQGSNADGSFYVLIDGSTRAYATRTYYDYFNYAHPFYDVNLHTWLLTFGTDAGYSTARQSSMYSSVE